VRPIGFYGGTTVLPQLVTTITAVGANIPAGSGSGLLQAGDYMLLFESPSDTNSMGIATPAAGFTVMGSSDQMSHSFAGDPREFCRVGQWWKKLAAGDITGGNTAAAIACYGVGASGTSRIGMIFRVPGTTTCANSTKLLAVTDGTNDLNQTVEHSLVPTGRSYVGLTIIRMSASYITFTGDGTVVRNPLLSGTTTTSNLGEHQVRWRAGVGPKANTNSFVSPNGTIWNRLDTMIVTFIP